VLGMNSFHSRDHKPALPAPTFPPTPYYHRLDVPIQRPIQSTNVRDFIDLWNELYFYPRYLEASLVVQHDSSDPAFAVNLAALSFSSRESTIWPR
jgi:hypothetical protein